MIRRGEGAGWGLGGPSWSPVGGEVIVFLQDGSQGNRTRATIKAHTTQPNRPRPYGIGRAFLRVMPIRADKSGARSIGCTINRVHDQ